MNLIIRKNVLKTKILLTILKSELWARHHFGCSWILHVATRKRQRASRMCPRAVFRFSLGARVQISVGRSRDLKNAEKWCYLK
jgi:hypothetical protein